MGVALSLARSLPSLTAARSKRCCWCRASVEVTVRQLTCCWLVAPDYNSHEDSDSALSRDPCYEASPSKGGGPFGMPYTTPLADIGHCCKTTAKPIAVCVQQKLPKFGMAMNSGSEENVTYRSVDEIGIDSPSKKEQDSQALIDSIVRVGAVLCMVRCR